MSEQEFFKEVFEEAPDAILVVDGEGVIVRVNRGVVDMFGFAAEELLGKPIEILIPERYAGPHVAQRKRYAARPEKRAMGRLASTLVGRHRSGREIPVDVMLSPLQADDKGLVMAVVRDVTERRRFQEKLQEQAAELKRSNEELEQFAYVASHDLQEPLRAVAASCQFIEKRLAGNLDADTREFLGFAVDGAKRMQALINDLLTYSRVNRHRQATDVALTDVVARVKATLGPRLAETGATIVHGELPRVAGDFSQLVQLFQNLVSNAVKFRGKEPPCVTISGAREDDRWVIALADNGIGIPREYQERIFVLFQRLHRREEYPGTGIGLAICKKIIEAHGGRIWVESTPGQGATFKFTLPMGKE